MDEPPLGDHSLERRWQTEQCSSAVGPAGQYRTAPGRQNTPRPVAAVGAGRYLATLRR